MTMGGLPKVGGARWQKKRASMFNTRRAGQGPFKGTIAGATSTPIPFDVPFVN